MEMQRILEERMKALLRYANYQHVGDAVGVSRTQVWRWARGESVTPGAVARVQAILRPDLPDTTEEALTPVWARGLPESVAEAVVMRLASPESPFVQQLAGRLEQLGLLPGGAPTGESVEPQAEPDKAPRLSE